MSYIISDLDRSLSEELESDVNLGSEAVKESFSVSIANQPIAMRLRDVYKACGKDLPPELALYKMFELWLIPHRFSLIRNSGLAEPTAVGIEVEYVHENTTCSVVSLLPGPKWKEHGKAALGGKLGGKLSATGEIEEIPNLCLSPLLRLGDLEFAGSTGSSIEFSFEWTVCTPVISAVGEGDSKCQWRFDKEKEPLFGKTIETWSVLALPRRQKTLEYRMRCYYLRRTLFFATRKEGDFVQVRCQMA